MSKRFINNKEIPKKNRRKKVSLRKELSIVFFFSFFFKKKKKLYSCYNWDREKLGLRKF